MYYYFRSSVTLSSAKVINVSAVDNTTPLSVTYESYGGYDSQDEGCYDMAVTRGMFIASGTSTSAQDIEINLVAGKTYAIKLSIAGCKGHITLTSIYNWLHNIRQEVGCMDCITGFKPPFGDYILSGWVRDASSNPSATTYNKPTIVFNDGTTSTVCSPEGEIIEGWQRIETKVTVGILSTNVSLRLDCASGGDCYFDDIRMFPIDGTMVTYVYDPVTLRLMAELDERNYAKYYEYDEEGKLIRIKKETENGVMTIQETRENNSGQ